MRTLTMAALALALLANLARAEDKPNPTGTWKWTVQAGGQAREQTIKLKLEGDKLTGASVARNGQETAIEEATFKDDTVSFKVTRERQGMKIIQKFSGKVSGDTIKGKISTDRDGQTRDADWEAKRAKDA